MEQRNQAGMYGHPYSDSVWQRSTAAATRRQRNRALLALGGFVGLVLTVELLARIVERVLS